MAEITWKSILTKLVGGDHLSAEESEEINDKLVDIETYIAVEYDKLVTGQTPISEIPNIQQRLIELGIEDCIAVYQQAYDRYLGQ